MIKQLTELIDGITDVGATTLARALNHANARSLRYLDLSYCSIDAIGLCNLAEALHHPDSTLESLDVAQHSIPEYVYRYYAEMLEGGNRMRMSGRMLDTLGAQIGREAMGVLGRFIGAGNQSLRALHIIALDILVSNTETCSSLKRIRLALLERSSAHFV